MSMYQRSIIAIWLFGLLTAVNACSDHDDGDPHPGGALQFDSANYAAHEDAVIVIISVTRTGGSQGAVSVDFSTGEGSASAGVDYLSGTGILQWADGELGAKTFTVRVLADLQAEAEETINLGLANPTGGAILGTPSVTVLTIQDAACSELSSVIDTDTVVPAGCYLVPTDVSVEGGATLTIEPRTTLLFAQDVRLAVWESSGLNAVGTADEPIVFTGVQRTRGYWQNVQLYNADSETNALAHVTVEYGGSDTAGLVVRTNSRVSVDNCVLRESTTYGLAVSHDSIVTSFVNNALTANTEGAAHVAADAVGYLDSTSTYVGNDRDVVFVDTYSSNVTRDQTWPAIDADYLIDNHQFFISAHLTIAPGATLVFTQDAEMYFDDQGALTAAGTAEAPIVFRGEEATRGYWQGLTFYSSNHPENRLDHVHVTDAGQGSSPQNVELLGSTQMSIENSTLANSAGYGLFISATATVNHFANNTLTGNAEGAAHVAADAVGYLDSTSTYVGNDRDVVYVDTYSSNVTRDQTWPAIDADYLIDNHQFFISAHLTIAPGATLVFTQDAEMYFDDQGALTAAGTAEAPIVFRGEEATRGYWQGLSFHDSNHTENQLTHVHVTDAGQGFSPRNVELLGSTRMSIEQSTLANSAGYGLFISATATVSHFANNTLTGNAEGAAHVAADAVGYLDSTSTYVGNDRDVVYVDTYSSNVTRDQTWPAIDVDYLIDNHQFFVSAHLTIAPGATLVFTQDAEMYVDSDGALTAQGTAAEPILFTGAQPSAGYWRGLAFFDSNDLNNILSHVTVEYGDLANIHLGGTSRASIVNSVIRHSSAWGIWIGLHTMVNGDVESANTFTDNASGDVYRQQ